jgi:hypothetical protein
MTFIDYSQYSRFRYCPWSWVEHYINQVDKAQKPGQRSDALCLGSLVHAGLEQWTAEGRPTIPEAVVAENNPTPETHALAMELLLGYVRTYPSEVFPQQWVERPLTFKLPGLASVGLAKLDAFFHVPEQTELESGIDGYQLSLSPGWWAREYKTKAATVDRGAWIAMWQTKLQASFQMLALGELIGEPVQGVLVSVLEKPREYTPKRKCQGCGLTLEMASFISTGDGHSCPMCGHVQKLNPYRPKNPDQQRQPEYFRVMASRTPDQLANDLARIIEVAGDMEYLRANPEAAWLYANKEACVDPWSYGHKRQCGYFKFHLNDQPALADGAEFVSIDPLSYVGLDA